MPAVVSSRPPIRSPSPMRDLPALTMGSEEQDYTTISVRSAQRCGLLWARAHRDPDRQQQRMVGWFWGHHDLIMGRSLADERTSNHMKKLFHVVCTSLTAMPLCYILVLWRGKRSVNEVWNLVAAPSY